MIQTIRIPGDRVGVLIGKGGVTKLKIEKATGVKLTIDSDEGEVVIDLTNAKDPGTALAVANVVTAIGRGFAPQKALLLLQDEYYLEVFDIRDYVGKRREKVIRMRSRIIGTGGKTREIIEELTGAFMSVSGNTVSLIGDILQLDVAKRAVDMILSGSEHAAVYHFLEGSRARLKVDGMGF
jgi:ribosomal RNA assembly protein